MPFLGVAFPKVRGHAMLWNIPTTTQTPLGPREIQVTWASSSLKGEHVLDQELSVGDTCTCWCERYFFKSPVVCGGR